MPSATRDSFRPAAQALLAREAARLPDLRRCTVLVPHFHAVTPFLASLHDQAARPVLLPPRITTLTALADSVPAGTPGEPDSLRLAQIQSVLVRTRLLPSAALWPAAQELLGLLDELSRQLVAPPADFAAFRQQCAAAYGRRLSQPLEREARLVFDLWYAMQQGERPDAIADQAWRLRQAADSAEGPLYCLGLSGLSRLEERFLERWGQKQAVYVLPEPEGDAGRRACLESVWEGGEGNPVLAERARGLCSRLPDSPLRGGLRLLAAPSLEAEAQGAARAIHAWIARGVERIGIVALDRMVARRLRALLERRQVLIQDETGWTFSTAAVSHVPDRLCALAADDCYYLDLLDLLKSPFVFADLDADARLGAVAELEMAIRTAGIPQGLGRFQRLAIDRAPDSLPLLLRLADALGKLNGRDTLAGWLRRLLAALDGIGARQAMQADGAGSQLWRLLEQLADDIAPHAARYAFADWRGWLLRQLEAATFLDTDIDSPVRLTHLGAARMRDFQAVILLGADAVHLPGVPAPGLFNEALRAELGLPGEAWRQRELRRQLTDVLCRTPELLITWQASIEGDPNALSPWLEMLDAMHRLAWGDSLKTEVDARVQPAPGTGTRPPAPVAPMPPTRLSASAWQSLVACPYQFWARHALGPCELEDVPEEPEKRDYGERVHAILHAFHRAHPRLADHVRGRLERELETLSRERFASLLESHYLGRAWLARWLRQVPGYLDWALDWEGRGYVWHAAELARRVELEYLPGRHLTLVGRLDRLDHMGQRAGACAVLDYKTQRGEVLRRKLRTPGEAVQLPFYGLLIGAGSAAYVALDDKQIKEVAWPGDLTRAAAAESERIAATWRALDAGARLPAQGAAQTCQWCEMRGLCRRDHWEGGTVTGDAH